MEKVWVKVGGRPRLVGYRREAFDDVDSLKRIIKIDEDLHVPPSMIVLYMTEESKEAQCKSKRTLVKQHLALAEHEAVPKEAGNNAAPMYLDFPDEPATVPAAPAAESQ
eukprot:461228-Amphidinium_carterae.1